MKTMSISESPGYIILIQVLICTTM